MEKCADPNAPQVSLKTPTGGLLSYLWEEMHERNHTSIDVY